ncbi:hypothetical protein MHM88_14330 [Epibacterium sp. MM17-32]|uniref:hypothetical protein n=1 Tax=Epibacterium sp. MM17-32 TaxID=2917734 RepID=UPI001EF57D2C|nr:hypothetical protein [Epibacterium sp. MM17-32]MCG7628985.1 hypothetical protein [Epibacterium sp. MM17-32]
MSTKKKIILHGHLAEKYPHEIVVEAATVAEALRSLETIEELRPASGMPWPVTVREVDNEISLFSETDMEEIHVYPRTGGAKRGGLLQIVLGVVLVALAVWNPAFLGMSQAFATQLGLAGGMMVLGGLLQMMMPTPQGYEESETSKYLNASGNTVKIGTRIPLAYGNNRLAGHYLSFDVDAMEWAGEDEEDGTPSLVGESVYVEHDKTPVTFVPVNPIFDSATLSPTNIPTSGWKN